MCGIRRLMDEMFDDYQMVIPNKVSGMTQFICCYVSKCTQRFKCFHDYEDILRSDFDIEKTE